MRTLEQQRTRLIPYKRRLKAFRTVTERMLADEMRKRGWWFKEQSALYDADHAYIADFLLSTRHGKLVIEIDGPRHEQNREYDQARDAWMKSQRSCCILRFSNKEVFNNLPHVLSAIGALYPRTR